MWQHAPSKFWKGYIEVYIAKPKILGLRPDYCNIRVNFMSHNNLKYVFVKKIEKDTSYTKA